MKYYGIGTILLGLAVGTVQADPVQWSVADGGNGHWYEGFAEADEISFEEANAHAISKGGYLASVTTEGESNFIKNNVANNTDLWVYDVNECLCGGPFIGGYRNSTEDWQWTDQSSWKWTSWHPGNPDGAFEDSQSVRLWDFSSQNWVDHRNAGETGSVVISYLVEWDSLPVQWRIEDGGNGHWYQLVESGKGFLWSEAVAEAESRGGYLVSLTSADEDAWVYANFDADNRWIGTFQDTNAADYSEPSGGWRWLSGENSDYSNWNGGGPDNGGVVDAPAEEYAHYCCGGAWNDIYGVDSFGVFVRKHMMVEFTTLPGSALGACCLDGLCITTAAADCSGNSGSWGGPNSSCADFNCPESCPSDVDGDGDVGVSDILMLIASWGACP